MLICPVCGEDIQWKEKTVVCSKGHSFDIAREGYVNLLLGSKSCDRIGDDKISARSRRDFLNNGYYALLCDWLTAHFANASGSLLDICCGEGYYTWSLARNPNLNVYGFDISREMVRLAARRGGITCFVANMANIPVASHSFDYALHLFAPFQEGELCRVLKPGGKLYTVIPGSRHLYGLKQALYDTPYLNDEQLPEVEMLQFCGKTKLSGRILLKSKEDIDAVFRMTPYYFHTSQSDKDKLLNLDSLETQIEFVIGEYKKEG